MNKQHDKEANKEITSWLRTGLEEYFFEEKGAWAFVSEAEIIASSPDLIFGLKNVYEAMPVRQREAFRQATADLLESLPHSDKYITIFECLISLIKLLPVPEALDAISKRVGHSFFGKSHNDDGNSLFAHALMAVSEMADKAPKGDATECLRKLITSSNFDSAYSGIALIALCKAEPDGLVEHLGLLSKPLRMMFDEFELDSDSILELITIIFNTVGLGQFVDAINSIVSEFGLYHIAYQWFMIASSHKIQFKNTGEEYLYFSEVGSASPTLKRSNLLITDSVTSNKRLPHDLPYAGQSEFATELDEAMFG